MTAPTQIYVSLEIGHAGAAQDLTALDAVINAGPVSSLLIRPQPGKSLDASVTKSLLDRAQKNGVAAFIADDANLARMLKADGLHISWSKETAQKFAEARGILGERFMIGGDAGRSRHDAMTLGEAGADYVAFGIPAHVEDRATAGDRQLDLISWWSEIFEIACVAFDVADAGQAQRLSQHGADFVGVTLSSAMTTQQIAGQIRDFQRATSLAGVGA